MQFGFSLFRLEEFFRVRRSPNNRCILYLILRFGQINKKINTAFRYNGNLHFIIEIDHFRSLCILIAH